MASAADLTQAAGQAFDNLFPLWAAGDNLLKSALALFAEDVLPIFPDPDPVGRPLGNWAIFMSSLANLMPTVAIVVPPTKIEYEQLVLATDYVYRICWIGSRPTPGAPAITSGQQAALLAAYNARF
jgi:hypothetical protein